MLQKNREALYKSRPLIIFITNITTHHQHHHHHQHRRLHLSVNAITVALATTTAIISNITRNTKQQQHDHYHQHHRHEHTTTTQKPSSSNIITTVANIRTITTSLALAIIITRVWRPPEHQDQHTIFQAPRRSQVRILKVLTGRRAEL